MREVEVHGLTERQAELVEAVIDAGTLKKACDQVSYDYRNARRLFNENAGFQQAVSEALRLAQVEDAIMARKELRDVLERTDEDQVKVRAAKDILDRGIGKAPENIRHSHEHKHSLDRDELAERISTLASDLGISPDALLQKSVEGALPAAETKPAEQGQSESKPTLPRLK